MFVDFFSGHVYMISKTHFQTRVFPFVQPLNPKLLSAWCTTPKNPQMGEGTSRSLASAPTVVSSAPAMDTESDYSALTQKAVNYATFSPMVSVNSSKSNTWWNTRVLFWLQGFRRRIASLRLVVCVEELRFTNQNYEYKKYRLFSLLCRWGMFYKTLFIECFFINVLPYLYFIHFLNQAHDFWMKALESAWLPCM